MPGPSRNRLKKVRLSELSLVDRPANPHAVVVIAKRATPVVSFREALSTVRQLTLTKYDPDQPREPAGSEGGGRWTAAGGAGGGSVGAAGGAGGSGGGTRQHRTEPSKTVYDFMSHKERAMVQGYERWYKPKDMVLTRRGDGKFENTYMWPDKTFSSRKEAWNHLVDEVQRVRLRATAEYQASQNPASSTQQHRMEPSRGGGRKLFNDSGEEIPKPIPGRIYFDESGEEIAEVNLAERIYAPPAISQAYRSLVRAVGDRRQDIRATTGNKKLSLKSKTYLALSDTNRVARYTPKSFIKDDGPDEFRLAHQNAADDWHQLSRSWRGAASRAASPAQKTVRMNVSRKAFMLANWHEQMLRGDF